jgi:hypothetical protein
MVLRNTALRALRHILLHLLRNCSSTRGPIGLRDHQPVCSGVVRVDDRDALRCTLNETLRCIENLQDLDLLQLKEHARDLGSKVSTPPQRNAETGIQSLAQQLLAGNAVQRSELGRVGNRRGCAGRQEKPFSDKLQKPELLGRVGNRRVYWQGRGGRFC